MNSLWCIASLGMLYIIIYQYIIIRKKNKEITSLGKWHILAFTDDLTGLQNHTAYSRQINVLESNNVAGWSLILFDIDKFKTINDDYGHLVGDEVLKIFSDLLETVFRGQDYNVYRIGGDEFAVISLHSNEKLIKELIGEITGAELNRLEFSSTKGYALRLQNDTFKDVFQRADKMLYHNKKIKHKIPRITNK